MPNSIKYFVLVTVVLATLGCNRERETTPDVLGLDYVPVQVGQYWIYDVHKITYNALRPYNDSTFETRVMVTEFFKNQLGDTVYTVIGQSKAYQSTTWLFDSVWQVQKNLYRYTETADNDTKVVLLFPLKEGKEWNANQLNADSTWLWNMQNVNRQFTHADMSYPNTLTIEQINQDDPIVKTDIRFRVFQKGVGEVFRYVDTRQHCSRETGSTCDEVANEKSINFLTLSLKESGILTQ